MVRVLPFLVAIVLAVAALISCLSAEDGEVRALPRGAWVVVILLVPWIGPIAYFAAGRPVRTPPREMPHPSRGLPEPERPRRVAPDDDPEFLRSLRAQQRDDVELLKLWEEDLRRREEELRRQRDNRPDPEP